ncbi:MAG: hypothetical protein HY332_15675 [Chloroflexi bacterium]|nr:hypothetical protein [Chloroflexota bacterium]
MLVVLLVVLDVLDVLDVLLVLVVRLVLVVLVVDGPLACTGATNMAGTLRSFAGTRELIAMASAKIVRPATNARSAFLAYHGVSPSGAGATRRDRVAYSRMCAARCRRPTTPSAKCNMQHAKPALSAVEG